MTGNGGIVRRNLEEDSSVIYLLNRNLCISYCNAAWDRFAKENGGVDLERERQVGRHIMEVVPRPLKRFFEEAYQRVLSSQKQFEHSYECSSPRHYRVFRQVIYPDPEGEGLVVVNALMVERMHRRQILGPNSVYIAETGLITMCSHCRRTRRVETARWDWVPVYVERTPDFVSHGICAACMTLFYPKFAQSTSG